MYVEETVDTSLGTLAQFNDKMKQLFILSNSIIDARQKIIQQNLIIVQVELMLWSVSKCILQWCDKSTYLYS